MHLWAVPTCRPRGDFIAGMRAAGAVSAAPQPESYSSDSSKYSDSSNRARAGLFALSLNPYHSIRPGCGS